MVNDIEVSTVSWETQQMLQGIIVAARESDRGGSNKKFFLLLIIQSNRLIPEEILIMLEQNCSIEGLEFLLHSKK